MPNERTSAPALLRQAFGQALAAAAPDVCLPAVLERLERRGPAVVIGAGKAAAAMAAVFAASWPAPVRGMVVTRYGHGLRPGEDAGGIGIVEAGHPSPDEASLAAGARLLELATSLRGEESLYCLISGGGSALACAPLNPLTFEQKRAAANFLIRCGADIREINCVRKHLSGIKGGRLAAAARPAAVTTYAISDVPGDAPADIASGPTLSDPSTQADALAILERYDYPARAELDAVLGEPDLETPKPDDPGFASDSVAVIASAATALDAAERFLREQGFEVLNLGDDLDSEAETLGREHARLAKAHAGAGARVALLSGGETRVVLDKKGGRGGRNLEYLSGLALELGSCPGVFALAADTDGIDGHGDHAGGFVVPSIRKLGARQGLGLDSLLDAHDTYRFFDACDLLIRTGPTRTNVNDFRLIVCLQ
ncbi:glycerate kinase type-2 family protein [Candidatus Rariloculus sp.]|uniref:glycerate kinase type-2 family protein n=1 Tax=Candidatus Rariloculus sp. TaxID=3101265 RepID=UPI003D0F5165